MEGKKAWRDYEGITQWGGLWPRHWLFTLDLAHVTKGRTLIVVLYLVLALVLPFYMHCAVGPAPASGYISRSLLNKLCNKKAFAATFAYVCFAVALFAALLLQAWHYLVLNKWMFCSVAVDLSGAVGWNWFQVKIIKLGCTTFNTPTRERWAQRPLGNMQPGHV